MISAKEAKEKSKYIHDKKIKKQEKELMRKINIEINRSIRKGLFNTTLYGYYLEDYFEKEAIENVVQKLRLSSEGYNVELDNRKNTRLMPNIIISWK